MTAPFAARRGWLPKTRKAHEPALNGELATVHLQAQLFVNLGR